MHSVRCWQRAIFSRFWPSDASSCFFLPLCQNWIVMTAWCCSAYSARALQISLGTDHALLVCPRFTPMPPLRVACALCIRPCSRHEVHPSESSRSVSSSTAMCGRRRPQMWRSQFWLNFWEKLTTVALRIVLEMLIEDGDRPQAAVDTGHQFGCGVPTRADLEFSRNYLKKLSNLFSSFNFRLELSFSAFLCIPMVTLLFEIVYCLHVSM